MSTTLVVDDYFSDGWKNLPLDCDCGWTGHPGLMRMQVDADASTYACPQCSAELLVVLHPDLKQVQRAAAGGKIAAIEQLDLLEEARAFLAARPASGS